MLATMAAKPLEIKGVLKDTWRLYRTLFLRSFLTGFIVFAALGIFQRSPYLAALVGFIGTTLVQGALVEVVHDEHRGLDQRPLAQLYRSSGARLASMLWVSILMGLGVGLGLVLLIVPGILLAIRWAVAVPVVMLEGLGARAAMRRSQELVRGHRKDVFLVLVNIWVRTGVVWILCTLLIGAFASGTSHPALTIWFGGVLAGAFITPYAAHALNVVYYRLTEPDRPLLPKTDPAWDSVWREHDATQS
jgi:Membrane domain of glycerophosphoryl diester phosphodiesterase